jgi:hypothetical protein
MGSRAIVLGDLKSPVQRQQTVFSQVNIILLTPYYWGIIIPYSQTTEIKLI